MSLTGVDDAVSTAVRESDAEKLLLQKSLFDAEALSGTGILCLPPLRSLSAADLGVIRAATSVDVAGEAIAPCVFMTTDEADARSDGGEADDGLMLKLIS